MNQENDIKISILRQDIDDLQNQQQELIKTFDNKNIEIEQTLANYNAKITALQKEGQKLIDTLDNEREQLRGAYQSLTKLIENKQKDLNNLLINNNELNEVKDNIKETIKDKKTEEKPKRTRKVKEVTETSDGSLTPEQIKAIEDLSNKAETTKKVTLKNQIKTEDIPAYLHDEYNKLNK